MSLSIRFTITNRKNNVLTDLTSAVLSDQATVYGVKRLDTSAIVVAVNTPLVHDSTGRYSYTLSGVTGGVIYRAATKIVYDNGDTRYGLQDQAAAIGSNLVDYSKFLRKWGNKALTEVTNKDHTAGVITPDDDLIADALTLSEARVNAFMQGGPLQTPLEFLGGIVSPIVEEWIMILAYARLYYDRFDDSASIQEVEGNIPNQASRRVKSLVSEVLDEMALAKSGMLDIYGATANTNFDRTPTSLTPRDSYDADLNLLFAGTRDNIWT